MKVTIKNNDIHVRIPRSDFNLHDTLLCGQCFRFAQNETEDSSFSGVAFGRYLTVSQTTEQDGKGKGVDTIIFHSTPISDFYDIWVDYFDLNGNYSQMKEELSFDDTISRAIEQVGGIRILKQDPWETICSFIISQNNNIPRIKGIVNRICELFGEEISQGIYAFPKPEVIAACTLEDLAPLRAGFRGKYILDAATKIANKEVDISSLWDMDTEQAQKELIKINGVGPKVADCALLFGFNKLDAFPIDVWIKKVLAMYYPDGFPEKAKRYAGVAQQYLFHYIRENEKIAKMLNTPVKSERD